MDTRRVAPRQGVGPQEVVLEVAPDHEPGAHADQRPLLPSVVQAADLPEDRRGILAAGQTLQEEVGQGSGKVDAEAVLEAESELVSVVGDSLDAPPGAHQGTVVLLPQPKHVVVHRKVLVVDGPQADYSRPSERLICPCLPEASKDQRA